jgi:hypothetical protein
VDEAAEEMEEGTAEEAAEARQAVARGVEVKARAAVKEAKEAMAAGGAAVATGPCTHGASCGQVLPPRE